MSLKLPRKNPPKPSVVVQGRLRRYSDRMIASCKDLAAECAVSIMYYLLCSIFQLELSKDLILAARLQPAAAIGTFFSSIGHFKIFLISIYKSFQNLYNSLISNSICLAIALLSNSISWP